MTITDEQWDKWLHILEDVLHEADAGQAFLFAIHINSAIEQVHRSRGTVHTDTKSHHLSSDCETSSTVDFSIPFTRRIAADAYGE